MTWEVFSYGNVLTDHRWALLMVNILHFLQWFELIHP